VAGVLEAYKARLPVFRHAVEGSGPIAVPTSIAARSTGPSVLEQNSILIYAYALALAARQTNRVSILDWGGGLGFFHPLSRALLPAEVEIEYHCQEVSLLCDYGRTAVPGARFYDDDSCFGRRYDLVLASSSLQYSEDWSEVLGQLAAATAGYLLITRVPVVRAARSFVVLQRAYSYGHDTEYLGWVLNQGELVDVAAGSDVELVREFLIGYRGRVYGAPEEVQSRGFLFRRTATSPA
jgi:putative methyltransferase (TIGR04325 family)